MWKKANVFGTSLKKTLLLLVLTLGLASCETSSPVIENFCLHDKIIYVSADDVLSTATILEILEHNELFEKRCL